MIFFSGVGSLDLVAFRRLHIVLCGLFCRGSRLNPLDDHGRVVLPGTPASRHERGCFGQLEC